MAEIQLPGNVIQVPSLHCKKVSDFSVHSRDVTNQTPWPGIIKLFPARESLVSGVLAGDGKIANLFYSVAWHHNS
jgi:hypothetical protein